MCDVSEGIPSTPMTRFERKRVPGKCIKCKTAQPNVVIRGCLYCKPCFVRASIAKFRTALSKSRKRAEGQPTDRAMVALSGGASSSSMLQLALDYRRTVAMKGGSAQPLYGDIVAGHIDESALFGAPAGDQGGIAGIVGKGTALHCARLEDVFAAGEEGEQPVLLQIVRANIAP
ncbi:Cytoplasmic tRNA 2-thiolation protein 2, partial [Kickxella alabastrina]